MAYYESGEVPSWRAVCCLHDGCTKSMRVNQEAAEDELELFKVCWWSWTLALMT